MVVPFGHRIAVERTRLGLTQERLAARIAISRAGLSHLEAGLAIASERTVTLLAGVFGCEPHELVEGSDYPRAKAERLPLATARYTEVDLALELLDNDVRWCERVDDQRVDAEVISRWRARLAELEGNVADPGERARVDAARRRLAVISSSGRTSR